MRLPIAVVVLMSALAFTPAGAEPAANSVTYPVAKGVSPIPPGASQLSRTDYMLLGLGALACLLFLGDRSRRE